MKFQWVLFTSLIISLTTPTGLSADGSDDSALQKWVNEDAAFWRKPSKDLAEIRDLQKGD